MKAGLCFIQRNKTNPMQGHSRNRLQMDCGYFFTLISRLKWPHIHSKRTLAEADPGWPFVPSVQASRCGPCCLQS